MCQSRRKGSGEITIFSYGISVCYKYDFSGLNGLNVARVPSGGRVKFLTTLVGKAFPLSGKRVHTRNAGMMKCWKNGMMPLKSLKPLKSFKS